MDTNHSNWHRSNFTVLPPPFISGSFILHPKRRSLILLGGFNPKENKDNGIWETEEKEWKQTGKTNQLSSPFINIAYDEDKRLAVLFGGLQSGRESMGETWLFDGDQLFQQQPDTSPPTRVNAGMAYDAIRKCVVLFGGQLQTNRFPIPGNDTWIWDGANWAQKFPSSFPCPRMGARMVFDHARQRIMLFGGCNVGGYLDDTWIWDGFEWNNLNPSTHPPARAYHGMVYDPEKQYVVLFGGVSLDGAMNDTWLWNGENWLQLQPKNVPPLETGIKAQLIYDSVQKSIMLYSVIQKKNHRPDDFQANSEIWDLIY